MAPSLRAYMKSMGVRSLAQARLELDEQLEGELAELTLAAECFRERRSLAHEAHFNQLCERVGGVGAPPESWRR